MEKKKKKKKKISRQLEGNVQSLNQLSPSLINSTQLMASDVIKSNKKALQGSCGDSVCQLANESCSTCPHDCGSCEFIRNFQTPNNEYFFFFFFLVLKKNKNKNENENKIELGEIHFQHLEKDIFLGSCLMEQNY